MVIVPTIQFVPSSWHEIVSGAPRAPVEQGAQMSVLSSSDVYYDPYDTGIHADPYPAFARLRAEAPRYSKEPPDFFPHSRYQADERSLVDRATSPSGKSGHLDLI